MNYLWFDGSLRQTAQTGIPPFTHALHYGSGVFEGIRAYDTPPGTAVFRLNAHIERFFRSAQAYGLQIPYDSRTLQRAVFQTLQTNEFTEGYIRPLAFFGEKGISLAPRFHCPTHVLVALRPLNGSLIGEAGAFRVCISKWQKTPSRSLPSNVKACGHYMNSILALQDALTHGFDEAVLLNDRGDVAEGTGENIFAVRDGRLYTNDASGDILEGITRDTVMTLARDRGIPVVVRPLGVDDLFSADELFFTGTAAEVARISHVDGRELPQDHPVTDELARAYAAAVRGSDPKHLAWVTYAGDISPSLSTSA
jgi:branched-chain amino acid aminotransferase